MNPVKYFVLLFSLMSMLNIQGSGCGTDDKDGDGFTPQQGDCDDFDSEQYPGAPDSPADGIDQDCGGTENEDPSVGLEGSQYSTIQSAIDGASVGATVFIGPGTYDEDEMSFRGKAITVRSTHGAEETFIDAAYKPHFYFTSGETSESILSGFTLRYGHQYAGSGGSMSIVDASPNIENVTFYHNTTDESSDGGAVYMENSAAEFSNCTFEGNNGRYGGAVYAESSTPIFYRCVFSENEATYGGGIAAFNSTVTVTSSEFTSNSFGMGAGIYGKSTQLEVEESTFNANSGSAGGGIYVIDSTLSVSDSLFEDNETNGKGSYYGEGGGLDAWWSSVTIQESTFTGNLASGIYAEGAAIFFDYCTDVLVNSCSINANTVSGTYYGGDNYPVYSKGGGIAISDTENARIENSIISGNVATSDLPYDEGTGGGIGVYQSTVSISNSLLSYNIAESGTSHGGAMHDIGSDVSITNTIVEGNSADWDGGAIYHRSGTLDMLNSTFVYNFSESGVGDLLCADDLMLTFNNSISALNNGVGREGIQDFLLTATSYHINYSQIEDGYGVSLNSTDLTVDPEFQEESVDYHLSVDSPLVNVGDPNILDIDGSRSDIGAFGGPGASSWDLDLDGYPNYFWPGTIDDAPEGFESDNYDSNDQDASVHD